MRAVFDEILAFLKKNDVYPSDEIVEPEYKPAYTPPTFIEAVNTILKTYECIAAMDLTEG